MSAPDEPGKVKWGHTIGDGFSRTVTFGWNMAGWSARAQLRRRARDEDPAATFACVVTPDTESSTVTLTLDPGDLTDAANYEGDLELTPSGGDPETWLHIVLSAREDWTR